MLCRSALALLAVLGAAACVVPPSSSMRLAESAHDLNTAARFGRMDIALEHVKDVARDDFNQRHATWGRSVRIVDAELGAVTIRKDGDADVMVTVNWQRLDETTMRSTELAQRWTEKRGSWYMTAEKERGGDRGLLAEAPKEGDKDAEKATPDAPPPQRQQRYQTRVIYEQ